MYFFSCFIKRKTQNGHLKPTRTWFAFERIYLPYIGHSRERNNFAEDFSVLSFSVVGFMFLRGKKAPIINSIDRKIHCLQLSKILEDSNNNDVEGTFRELETEKAAILQMPGHLPRWRWWRHMHSTILFSKAKLLRKIRRHFQTEWSSIKVMLASIVVPFRNSINSF